MSAQPSPGPLTPILESGAALEREGRWLEAYARYNEAFRGAARRADTATMLRALLSSAIALRQNRDAEGAADVSELTLELARIAGITRMVARSLNHLGVIHHELEDWRRAELYYNEALAFARDEGDDALIGAICPNLGAVANATGDLREARALYLEGISACVRAGSALTAGNTYNNLGMVCADMEEWTEAEIHFLRGAEIAERLGDLRLLARVLTGRAEPLIRTGEVVTARGCLDRAETLSRQYGDQRALADIERYRGLMARLQGDLPEAESHLDRSLSIAVEAGLELERAEALEEMAHLREAQARGRAAGIMLREARRAYEAIGAARDIARVDGLKAQWEAATPQR